MASTITRTAIVDDDGTRTTGTALDSAWKDELYDQIDDMFSNGLELGDYLEVTGDANGVAAFAGDRYSHVLVAAGLNANPLTAIHQVGFYAAHQANSSVNGASGFVAGFESAIGLAAGSYTVGKMAAFAVGQMGPFGAGAAATRTWNFSAVEVTAGVNNAVMANWDATFTGNWWLYYAGSLPSRLGGGDLIVGTETYRTIDTGYYRAAGGNAAGTGASIALFGSTHATDANKGQLYASGGWTVTGTFTMSSNPATYGVIFDGSNGGGIAATHASGALRFYAGGTTEAMRVAATGQFFVKATVGVIVNPSLGVAFTGSGNFGTGLELIDTNNTSGASFAVFTSNGAKAGEITRVGTTAAVVYTTTSDERLKRDFRNFTDALDRVRRIDAGTFAWITDGAIGSGVKAQQLHAIYPDAVTQGETWAVDYGRLTPLLIGAIKELADRLDAMRAEA